MANKRDASSQKRSRSNRAQREALAARTAAAGTPRPSRQPPAAARRTNREVKRPIAETQTTTKGSARGARPTRPVRERPVRPGDVPVDIDTLEGSFMSKVMQVPGGRQVFTAALSAIVLSVVTVVLAALVHGPPHDAKGKAITAKTLHGKPVIQVTQMHEYGVAATIIPPAAVLLVSVLALAFALRRYRRRVWFFATIVAALAVLQGGSLFIIVAGYMGYGCYRASKVEGPQRLMGGTRGGASSDADIIDADGSEVDDEGDDDRDDVLETTGAEDDRD